MAQYEVFKNPGRLADEIPFLLDVQNNHIAARLNTTIVVPLMSDKSAEIDTIAPLVVVPGYGEFVLSTVELFGIDSSRLKKAVATLSKTDQAKIQPALDKVFGNY